MIHKIIVIVISIFYQSCINSNHDIAYYTNGNKKYDIEYKNGKIDGKAKYWNNNGDLINVVNYRNNLFHGDWIDYYSNGNIQHVTTYAYGHKNGEEIWYYKSGQIKSKVVYNYDEIITDLVRWDENGILIND